MAHPNDLPFRGGVDFFKFFQGISQQPHLIFSGPGGRGISVPHLFTRIPSPSRRAAGRVWTWTLCSMKNIG